VLGTTKLVESARARFDDLAVRSALSAYRSSARVGEPIFDVPRRSRVEPLHEARVSGYPHLFVATMNGAAIVRAVMAELGARETPVRGAFGHRR
jgi:hypothetical protein